MKIIPYNIDKKKIKSLVKEIITGNNYEEIQLLFEKYRCPLKSLPKTNFVLYTLKHLSKNELYRFYLELINLSK